MIRPFKYDDGPASYVVYRDAARHGSQPHYTPQQGLAWAPSDTPEPWWKDRLLAAQSWVFESDGQITGVIALTEAGHLDLFFVLPECRRTGVAPALYDTLLDAARAAGHSELTTDASHLARRFLARRGWTATGEETVERNGQTLSRVTMTLTLSPSAKSHSH